MRTTLLFLLLASFSRADISVPLKEGELTIRNARFIRITEHSFVPELSFDITNQTLSRWDLSLLFHIGAFCNGHDVQEWTIPVHITLDARESKTYKDTVLSLFGMVDQCRTKVIQPNLASAINPQGKIEAEVSKLPDLKQQVLDVVEQERVQNEAKEQKAIDADRVSQQDARAAYRAQQQRQAATRAQAQKLRTEMKQTCKQVFAKTADKKVGDLTVREAQQVKACQAVGLYSDTQ